MLLKKKFLNKLFNILFFGHFLYFVSVFFVDIFIYLNFINFNR